MLADWCYAKLIKNDVVSIQGKIDSKQEIIIESIELKQKRPQDDMFTKNSQKNQQKVLTSAKKGYNIQKVSNR